MHKNRSNPVMLASPGQKKLGEKKIKSKSERKARKGDERSGCVGGWRVSARGSSWWLLFSFHVASLRRVSLLSAFRRCTCSCGWWPHGGCNMENLSIFLSSLSLSRSGKMLPHSSQAVKWMRMR